ncbi:hypothetical protein QSV34_01270 [Porticoccus sp. W117]|uniref:hypothetical protein n=1 Tax=Porticoccus sp. W117 TaxID=3054777 RepID=UPI002597952E|nr:hypothetical protein [Porticoccus sp. W117]MDM3869976.1 hypothetical protein [Porticoccus sp. W117]
MTAVHPPWAQRAEQRYRQLCLGARTLFDDPQWPFDHTTGLAYLEVANHLARQCRGRHSPLMVGISGGQGAGKSTLSHFVGQLLSDEYGLSAQVLSLDDFYFSKARRQQLAQEVHPLFTTRGVPGTHDLQCLNDVLAHLQSGNPVRLAQFDKSDDDLLPERQWQQSVTKPDVILLEGWCMGALPQPQESLVHPVNILEAQQDADARWRHQVNRYLQGSYKELFQRLDTLLYLQVPDITAVRRWRHQQEAGKGLSQQQVDEFVQYFERLTDWMQQTLPQRADLVLALSATHQVQDIRVNAT